MATTRDRVCYTLSILSVIEDEVAKSTTPYPGETHADNSERVRTRIAHVVSIYCAELIDSRIEHTDFTGA